MVYNMYDLEGKRGRKEGKGEGGGLRLRLIKKWNISPSSSSSERTIVRVLLLPSGIITFRSRRLASVCSSCDSPVTVAVRSGVQVKSCGTRRWPYLKTKRRWLYRHALAKWRAMRVVLHRPFINFFFFLLRKHFVT
jgi:hypothetical protein